MTFIMHLGVKHVIGGTAMGFKSVLNNEGFSGETSDVGSCNDPATFTPVAPSLVAICRQSVRIKILLFLIMLEYYTLSIP